MFKFACIDEPFHKIFSRLLKELGLQKCKYFFCQALGFVRCALQKNRRVEQANPEEVENDFDILIQKLKGANKAYLSALNPDFKDDE